jgi:hypothetical protein
MSMTGALVNVGWIVFHCVVLLLVGVIIQWIMTLASFPPPEMAVRLFLVLVAIYAIISLLVVLITGMPVSRVL